MLPSCGPCPLAKSACTPMQLRLLRTLQVKTAQDMLKTVNRQQLSEDRKSALLRWYYYARMA
jgi:hypothetical protein